jgi:putative peptide zinc metalloprotease protein
MDEAPSTFSPLWYRVATLTPRLRGQVRVERQSSRGERWHVLVDDAAQRLHRLDAAAWDFVGLFDGERTVEQIWRIVVERGADDAPTQGDVVRLLSELHHSGLIQANLPAHAGQLHEQATVRRRRQRLAMMNPFSFRVPLADPTRLLDRLSSWTGCFFGAPALALWAVLVASAMLVALGEADALRMHGSRWLATPYYLTLMWVCYPPIKVLHEIAHALAVRRFGGEVREMGLTLLLLTPVPYVDASAANAFADRNKRALVAAAGIMVELGLAAIALFAWLSLENGLLRDLAFVTMFVGSASTLLVNGNPLIRMDGYHVASDLLDLPNLASRSRRYWQARFQGMFNGAAGSGSPSPARGEVVWLALYAPLSLLYMLALLMWIVGWLGSVHAWLGYATVLIFGWSVVGAPFSRLVAGLLAPTLPDVLRRRARLRLGVLAAVGLIGVCLVPVPNVTLAQGVVWLPEDAWIRADTDGFAQEFARPDGTMVDKGMIVAQLSDDQLLADRDAARERATALRTQLYASVSEGWSQAGALHTQIAAADAGLARLEQRVAALVVKAPASGRLVTPHQSDMVGRWMPRGAALGHVLPASNRTVRVALPHEDAQFVADDLQAIELRTLDSPGRILHAAPRVTLAGATKRLPSRALGKASGGGLVVDPADPEGLATRDAIAVLDLEVSVALGERVGTRVSVRFQHHDEVLLLQGLRRIRQLLLRQFRVDT